MRTSDNVVSRASRAFTIIELLVVIAVIGIMAGLLLPAINGAKTSAKVRIAKSEMSSILAAIKAYDQEYGSLPCSKEAYHSAAANSALAGGCGDFTYGTMTNGNTQTLITPGLPSIVSYGHPTAFAYYNNNSEVVSILMDLTNFVNGTVTVNGVTHDRNPHRIAFLEAKQATDATSPGVGTDGVFRDPWGNPYIISFNLDGSGYTIDGLYGAFSDNFDKNKDDPNLAKRRIRGTVLIWSLGPDGKADVNPPNPRNVTAWKDVMKLGVNKDNVISWEP